MDSETQKEEVDQSKVSMASVIRLIDSIDFEHLNLDKHREVCLGINEIVTENSVDLLDEHFIDRVLEYLKILICMCDGHKFLGFAKNAITKFPLNKVESSISQLISSRKDELESELYPVWYQHQNMCAVIEKVLKAHRDSLEQTVINQMFDYCSKVIHKCNDAQLISRAFFVFSKFPLTKLELSLPNMIEPLKNKFETKEQTNWCLHNNFGVVIEEVLDEHRDSLTHALIDQMFEYLTDVISKCENVKQISYAIGAFTKFPLAKLETSLPQSMRLRKDELESEPNPEWYQHQNMCAVIEKVLKAHRDSLEQTLINQMFDYCSKVIQSCNDAQQISRAFFVFRKFPLAKLESSLPNMIERLKSKFETKELTNLWYLHNNFGVVIEEVLDEHRDSLTHALIDQIFEYLTDVISKCENVKQISCAIGAFTKFPLAKLEPSLSQLISSRKDELESELNPEWHQHQNMCAVIEKVLKAHRDSLEQTFINQMFDYCSKLLRKCDNSKLISCCFCAFSQFPLSKLESSLPSMIETLQGEFKATEQQSKWYLHDNMSGVIYGVLDEWQESLNQAVIDQMFAYLVEIIHRCTNGELISISFEAFGKFPLIKLQSSLPQLIRSMEDQLECDQCTEWFPHDNFGSAMQFVLMAHSMLDQTIIEQMCEYCTKLVHSCEHGQLIGVFAQFPPSELLTSLGQLIGSMANKLESGQTSTKWFKHENLCIAIQDILDLHCTTLPQELINQIFAYLTKLLFLQRGENHLKEALIAFAKIPLKRIEMIMSEMIKSTAEFLKYQNASGIIEKC